MKKLLRFVFVFLVSYQALYAQKPQKLSSNEIYEKIQKLNFLGTALYVAAHPDDENTRLIAYLANEVHARTGYLSLTRGDGGQNLIGPEIRELLGVIRTQELLAARRVDGGEQLFTRANDFGYSKHPDETLEIWDKDKVLSDVVWAIRTFKPDVIINRFNHRTPGTTHGHHTTSAMLSVEAFDMVNDKTKFANQLKYTTTWQPKRLFFNTSSWFYRNRTDFVNASKDFTKLDVGVYYQMKGLSNNEIASTASSQHLSQGFGRLNVRGSQDEYLEFLKGEALKDKNDIFSGINTTWNRVEGGGEIGNILYDIEENFNFKNPSAHVPKLLEAYSLIKDLKDEHWKNIKQQEIISIIESCMGLYLEANAISSSAVPNTKIDVNFELINRSNIPVTLISVTSLIDDKTIFKGLDLEENKRNRFKETITLKTNNFSAPYWLKDEGTIGMYKVNNQQLIGKPETPKKTQVSYNLVVNFVPITITKNIIRVYSERDKGEIYEPFEILPKVTTKLKDKVIVFADSLAKKVTVEVKAGANFVNGKVSLKAPKNWIVSPAFQNFNIQQKNNKQTVEFSITPLKNQSEGELNVVATVGNSNYNKELVEINYTHIPKQSVLLSSKAKVVRLNIKTKGRTIGYIKGAGDNIPENLRQIGYTVFEINPKDITAKRLENLDAVVTGIRAYNISKELGFKQKLLLDYVKKGGNLIVQYNTSRNIDVQAPFSLQLSRDRVTDENAAVTILDETHPLVNFPNKITQEDFKGWVQERGLYFPNTWSKEFTPIFSMNDKGESSKKGSLLVAKYGKGNYVYTGLSFFRELPAGVSGAYKLFANILSLEENKEDVQLIKE